MATKAREALDLLTPRLPRHSQHYPEPRQQVFLLLEDLEALYGGAAGGGKSDALLMCVDQYTDVPGYAALVVRKTYAELNLPGAVMARSKEWWQGQGHWDEGGHTWTFKHGDWGARPATVTFGHLQHGNDKYRYQSAEFQTIAFDELTEFQEAEYTFLISRCRRPSEGPLSKVPLRMRNASNPGGVGHNWVKSRFIPEVDEYGVLQRKRDENGNRRPFIPARIEDNPHIDRESYMSALRHLDPVTRERLLNGDWDVRVGGMFSRAWFSIVSATDVPNTIGRQLRYWDLAASEAQPGTDPDYTASFHLSMDKVTNEVYVRDGVRIRAGALGVEQAILERAHAEGKGCPIYIEQEPGAGSKLWIDSIVRKLAGWVVIPIPSRGSKPVRAGPFASYAQAGHVKLVEGLWIPEFLAEAESFSADPDQKGGPHDDQVDAVGGGFTQLTSIGPARSRSTIPGKRDTVVRRGDLVLRGERYIDKPPIAPTR